MNTIAACPSSKTGIKTTLLNSCVSVLKKIHSVQNMLQRYFVHVLFSHSKIAGKPHFFANGVTWHVFAWMFFFLPCFCHSSFAPEILFPFLSIQQASVIYYFASCRLLIPLCGIDYSCWLNYFFLWERRKSL